MTTKIEVNQAAELLLAKDNILVLCHKNPDGDTLGSAAALCHVMKNMGKTIAAICHHSIPAKYDYLDIPLYNEEFEVEYVVSVDVAGVNLLGENLAHYAHKVDLCIDHHESNNGYSNYLCLKEDYPAAAQLMYEIIVAMGCEITPHVADCLYTGLITDTGCFKYSSTTPLTHIVGARLMELGAQHTMLVEKFFMSKTAKAVKLEKFMLNNLEYHFDDRCALLALTREVMQDIKPEPTDIDGLSSMPRNFEGVDVSILIRPLREDGSYKLSIRTGETVNANEIAAALGGGGHIRAAGCEVIGSIDSVKKAILKEVENVLCR
ncbi:MAG: bifunctional oligoribonuclease/PAP phosphatase NrnA [Oscillospiraceae bacterium]|nr:bifunctional oligoribonuclease/PAP phosphatase NrnA [Oscillospiraceae bacterium]